MNSSEFGMSLEQGSKDSKIKQTDSNEGPVDPEIDLIKVSKVNAGSFELEDLGHKTKKYSEGALSGSESDQEKLK